MKTKLTILSTLTLVWLAGCTGPHQTKPDAAPMEQGEKVVLMDSKLKGWLRVNAMSKKYTEDGRLIAYAEIRNNHNKPLIIEIQTVFKDANNVALGDATNWQSIIVPQNAVEYYQAPAYSIEAKEYVIRIKRGGIDRTGIDR